MTQNGVYYIANSIPSATNANPTWVNITGNLKTLAYSIFGQGYNPATDTNTKPYDLGITLSSIIADWRYAIPNNPSDPTQGYHPVLYVGADSGVFVSYNEGKSWNLFPETLYGAVTSGGYLPHESVTSMGLSLGDINTQTGMGTLNGPYAPNAANQTTAAQADPDLLMASTYGQGEYAINLAPLILQNPTTGQDISVTGGVGPATPTSNGLPAVSGPLTIGGESEITNFGDATWITIEDVTNPADPVVVAGFNPQDPVPTPSAGNSTNAIGGFSLAFNPETYYATDGPKTIEVFATDNAGSVGNLVKYSFDLNPPSQLQFASNGEPPATATAGQDFAASPQIVVVDVEDAAGAIVNNFNGPVTIGLANGATGTFDASSTLTVNAVNGVATFSSLAIDTAGTYQLSATSPNLTPGTSTSITINPAAASKVFWTTEPASTVTEGFPFSATLAIEDQYGNLETTAAQGVTLALEFNGSPDTTDLAGTTTATTSGGVATFSNIVVNNIGQPYTLTATGGSLTSAVSTAIDVVAPTLVAGNHTAQVTAGVKLPLSWTALTNTGAIDTAFNGTVTLTIFSGPANATILGTTTATASNGVASFSGVILDTAGSYTIRASSGNLTPGNTNVTVVAAAATGLLITQEPPSSVTAGAGFGFQVAAEDQFGNQTALTGVITATLSTNPGGSTLGGTTTMNASGGVANFGGLTLNIADSGYVIQVFNERPQFRDHQRDHGDARDGHPARDPRRRRAAVHYRRRPDLPGVHRRRRGPVRQHRHRLQRPRRHHLAGHRPGHDRRDGRQRRGDLRQPLDRHGRVVPAHRQQRRLDHGHLQHGERRRQPAARPDRLVERAPASGRRRRWVRRRGPGRGRLRQRRDDL